MDVPPLKVLGLQLLNDCEIADNHPDDRQETGQDSFLFTIEIQLA